MGGCHLGISASTVGPPSPGKPGIETAEGVGVTSAPPPASPAKPASSSHTVTSFLQFGIHRLDNTDSSGRTYFRTDFTLTAESLVYHRYAILYPDSPLWACLNTKSTTATFLPVNKNHTLTSNVFQLPGNDLPTCPSRGRVVELALCLMYCRQGKAEGVHSWQLQKAHPIHDHKRN